MNAATVRITKASPHITAGRPPPKNMPNYAARFVFFRSATPTVWSNDIFQSITIPKIGTPNRVTDSGFAAQQVGYARRIKEWQSRRFSRALTESLGRGIRTRGASNCLFEPPRHIHPHIFAVIGTTLKCPNSGNSTDLYMWSGYRQRFNTCFITAAVHPPKSPRPAPLAQVTKFVNMGWQ